MTYSGTFFSFDFHENIWFFEKFFVILHPNLSKLHHEAILVFGRAVRGIGQLH